MDGIGYSFIEMNSNYVQKNFNEEIPFLNRIKFNSIFKSRIINEFKIILTNPLVFPNLKTLEFEDLTFNFKSNGALISFIE